MAVQQPGGRCRRCSMPACARSSPPLPRRIKRVAAGNQTGTDAAWTAGMPGGNAGDSASTTVCTAALAARRRREQVARVAARCLAFRCEHISARAPGGNSKSGRGGAMAKSYCNLQIGQSVNMIW
jgi:hypothetical protein